MKVLPKPVPSLPKEAAEQFEAQDKEPLSTSEKAFLEECVEVYESKWVNYTDRDRRVKTIEYLKMKERILREKRLKLEALVQEEVKT